MKKYLVTSIMVIIIFSTSIYGQEKKVNKNHIGINLFSLKSLSENYVQDGNFISYPNGLIIKHDVPFLTLRYYLTFNKFYRGHSDPPYVSDGMSDFNHYALWTIGSGVQKNIDFNKLRLYYGLDIFNDFSIYKREIYGGIAGFNMNDNFYHVWIGLRPIAGLQYQVTKHFSLSIETNYSLAYRITNTDDRTVPSVNKFQGYFNPINALSVSFDF